MSRKVLEDWLQTDESKVVGQLSRRQRVRGPRVGRRIVELLDKKKPDYTDHMRCVLSCIHRH